MTMNPLDSARYVVSAHTLGQLPTDAGREIAFAGRSNVGKSTAINVLARQRKLARTSRTPGRTQQMVVFALADGARIVDLPGYGYAQVSQALRAHWHEEIDAYLRTRRSLRGLVLIADIRHALTEFDRRMLAFCAGISMPCLVLLSKADKLSHAQTRKRLREIETELAMNSWTTSVVTFSAQDGTGVDAARGAVVDLLAAPRHGPAEASP